jgi:hypothetical protein
MVVAGTSYEKITGKCLQGLRPAARAQWWNFSLAILSMRVQIQSTLVMEGRKYHINIYMDGSL